MERLIQDLHFALRQLRRSPGFALVVVLTLAVGIGANTTIFSAVNELLLKPLPYPESEELVSIAGSYEGRGDGWSVSYPNARDWRTQNRTFDEVAWYQGSNVSLVGGDRPERIEGVRASWSLFPLLGINPAIGRAFTEAEDAPNAERVVVISHGLWQRHFGGKADVLGRSISLSGNAFTVVGVMPEGFSFPAAGADFLVPVRANDSTWARSNGGLQVVARLKQDATIDAARGDMKRVTGVLAAEYANVNGDLGAALTPFREALYGAETARVLLTMLGAVGFVLLIVCVNVANLLLARATGREREMAVRAAIGAGRRRVVRQLLTESIVLALIGGGFGVILSLWGTQAISAAMPEGTSLPTSFSVDRNVLLFAIGLSFITGMVFGLAPALHSSRTDLNTLLAGRSGHQNRRRGRRRNLLVVAEVALALMLLVGAGLMIRSFATLLGTSPGFDPTNLVTLRVGMDTRYETAEDTRAFQRRVLEAVRGLPGVEQVGSVDWMPLSGTNNFNDFYIAGREGNLNAGNVMVSDGYLEAMRIPVDRGRTFTAADGTGAPGVAIISRALAEQYFKGQDALGKVIQMGWDDAETKRTIVGITGNVRHGGIDADERAEIYVPLAQVPWRQGSVGIVARVRGDAAAAIPAVQNAIWSVDPNQMIYDVRTGQKLVAESQRVMMGRIMAATMGLFAAVALVLAALGLYGVISYGVAQRTYEIGVRSALGASRHAVLRMVLGQGLRLVAAGLVIGLAAAYWLARIMSSLLFGIEPRDPVTFAVVPLVLLAVATLASLLPAMRAARVDPIVALRTE